MKKATRRFSPQALALAYKVFEKQRNSRTAKNYAGMLLKMFPNSYQAKQYILNELEHIEADDLAKAYQATKVDTTVSSPNKRVVVLSPKKPRKILPIEINKNPSITKSSVVKTVAVESNQTNQSKVKHAPDRKIHIVQAGESLFTISALYNVHMYTLESWNNIFRDNILSLGQRVYVSSPEQNKTTTNRATKNNVQEKTQ